MLCSGDAFHVLARVASCSPCEAPGPKCKRTLLAGERLAGFEEYKLSTVFSLTVLLAFCPSFLCIWSKEVTFKYHIEDSLAYEDHNVVLHFHPPLVYFLLASLPFLRSITM